MVFERDSWSASVKIFILLLELPRTESTLYNEDNRHRDYLLSTDSSEHLIPPLGGRRKGKEANLKNLFKCQYLNTCGICLPWSIHPAVI